MVHDPNKPMTVLTALGNKNMPMTKPMSPTERNLERTPSNPARMETTLQTGTIHPGLNDAIVHPMMPATRAVTLHARNTGRVSATNSCASERSTNRRFQIDVLVSCVVFATGHLKQGIRINSRLLQSVSKIQDPPIAGMMAMARVWKCECTISVARRLCLCSNPSNPSVAMN